MQKQLWVGVFVVLVGGCKVSVEADDSASGAGGTSDASAAPSATETADADAGTSTNDAGAASTSPSPTALLLYAGTWAYEPGSALVVACPGAPATIVDLATAGQGGSAATFELSMNGESLHEVDGLGCEHDFVLRDGIAVTGRPETCSTFPDGRGGTTTLTSDATNKSTRDGKTMHVAGHGKVGESCDLWLEGFATRQGDNAPALPPSPPAQDGNERDRYRGTWAYAEKSALVVVCPNAPASVTDLHSAANGEPGTFSLSPLGNDALHEVDGLGCQYDMSIVDGAAVLTTAQTCASFPDGRGGTTTLETGPTRKASWDGEHMVVAARAKLGDDCELFLAATAAKAK